MRDLTPDEQDFCDEWRRDMSRRSWVRQIDRAIKRAQTPARLYSIRQHRKGA